MKLSTKVAYNTIIQFTSKVIATALGLVAVAVIARYLGREGYGEYTTIITFLSFFGIAADLGLTLVTVQLISLPGADEEKTLGNLFALRLVSALIFLGLAPIAVMFFPYSAGIKIGVAITSLSFIFIALNQILVGLFQKHLRLDKVSIAEVVSRIILVIGVVFAVRSGSGLMGILIATVVSSAIGFLLHFVFSRSFTRIRLQFDLDYWREIISRSWPLTLTIVFNLIYLKTDTLLLSLMNRNSELGLIAEVGLYGAAYKVIDVLITFPFMFAGIILPILTAAWAEKNYDHFKSVMQRSFELMVILAIPIMVGTQLLAEEVMTMVAGREFALSGSILRVLILAAGIIFISNIFPHAMIAMNKQKKLIGAYLFTAVTAVIGYFIFIPRFSYYGAAWVTIYSELAIGLAALYLVRKYTDFFPNINTIFKSLLASVVMGFSIYLSYIFLTGNLLIVILLAIIIYFIALYLLGGLRREDIASLLNR